MLTQVNITSFSNANKKTCPVTDFRTHVLASVGITDAEAHAETLVGPLDELKASNIRSGPFDIDLTEVPREHLTLTRLSPKPTIKLLKFEKIFNLFKLDGTEILR